MTDSSDLVPRECPLAHSLATRLHEERRALTAHWLERIVARVSSDVNSVFPSEELLDHVPLLIEGIAQYLDNPAAEVGADTPVVGKAMELGALRHSQGFDVYEILKEYEILGGILFSFLARVADTIDEPCKKGDLLVCGHRLFRAIAIIQETTTAHFEVRDNGLGVPAERREGLFQRFFRAHTTVTRAEGTGLGLSIVRESIQSLGGDTWAEFPDEGSVFAFSLPLRRSG